MGTSEGEITGGGGLGGFMAQERNNDGKDAQLVKPQPAPQEDNGEDSDKEDERAPGHLIDRDRGV